MDIWYAESCRKGGSRGDSFSASRHAYIYIYHHTGLKECLPGYLTTFGVMDRVDDRLSASLASMPNTNRFDFPGCSVSDHEPYGQHICRVVMFLDTHRQQLRNELVGTIAEESFELLTWAAEVKQNSPYVGRSRCHCPGLDDCSSAFKDRVEPQALVHEAKVSQDPSRDNQREEGRTTRCQPVLGSLVVEVGRWPSLWSYRLTRWE